MSITTWKGRLCESCTNPILWSTKLMLSSPVMSMPMNDLWVSLPLTSFSYISRNIYTKDLTDASQERVSNIEYNVVNGKCSPVHDESSPVYITIGDGGNQEGLVTEWVRCFLLRTNDHDHLANELNVCRMTQPQPSYSAYREASYGHGIFDIKNRTHAYFGWHRNQDGYAVEADSLWLVNRYWGKSGKGTSAVAGM